MPDLTFEIDILDVDLKEHILFILQEAGIDTLGDLILQMRLDPDRILALNGIGPKSFEEISELTDALRVVPEEEPPMAAPIVEEVVEVEPEPMAEVEPEATPEVPEVTEALEIPEEEEEVIEEVEEEILPEEEAPPEEKEFDKLFSYDARKYGYYEPEPAKFDEEEEEPQKPSKKKKKKKRRPASEERDDWEDW